ncbi:hypothetical protein HZA97_06740 [Candidatus Woesearchaeota archaeon]|nr:hypothetical protein [Candidatus Woesearchaeota archaeon]
MSSTFDNEVNKALEDLKTKEDFKHYFEAELINEEDPYSFSKHFQDNGRGGALYCPGVGISEIYLSLSHPDAPRQINISSEEISKRLAAFLDAVVDCLTDANLFYKKTEKKFLGPGAKTGLFGIDLWRELYFGNKNEQVAQKLFSLILFEDMINQKMNEKSPNFEQQYYLMRTYFDLLPVENYDFEMIEKLSLNPSLSSGMFQVLLEVDRKKAKDLALSAIAKGVKSKDLELSLKDYFPGIKF